MNRNVKTAFLGMVCGAALAAGGCAKKEMVKADGQIAPIAIPVAEKVPVSTKKVTEAPVKTDAAIPPAQTASGAKERLNQVFDDVYFNFDSAALSSDAMSSLTRIAERLKSDPATMIRIEGNCDERGSDEYNLALGDRRAYAARQYLSTLGISAYRLATVSFGKEKPADPGHDEGAWARNRRDEFVVVSK